MRFWGLICFLAASAPAFSGVTPEMQRAIRASTFEVVLKKPTRDPVTYEKPLPLELLPFIERTDLYRSVGTAFSLGKNTYATAAHVLVEAIDSQYGAPALRSADGSVHPIGSVLKFSAHEDFVVFSLADNLDAPGLPTSAARRLDDPVLAVGNALGDGIVIRDGLFTSETLEEQDGRWKWIRFSAAASPGNSGGPLLNAEGQVIGIVVAKSPNENLNFALPISNALSAPGSKARFDQRRLVTLPYLHGSRTYTLQDEFSLPLPWDAFAHAYQQLTERHNDKARQQLLAAYADSLFPKGNGTEAILYQVDTNARRMGLLIQDRNDTWSVDRPKLDYTDLPDDGRVGITWIAGVGVLRLVRGNEAADGGFYSDSKAFMDLALKALNLTREVGSDDVRVTSLGPAQSDVRITDAYGRVWQERLWPVPFLDSHLVALLLPTPEGYAALLDYAPSPELRETRIRLELLANQVSLPYEGTLNQWQAYLGRKALLPEPLKNVTLDAAGGWLLRTRLFETAAPSFIKAENHSRLLLNMAYMHNDKRVVWDIGSAWWLRSSEGKAYLGLWRQPRPPSTAKLELRNEFTNLQERHSPYDGQPVRDGADTMMVSMMIQAPGTKAGTASADVAYGATLRLEGRPSFAELVAQQTQALKSTRILEHGIGADVAASAPTTVVQFIDDEMQRLQGETQKYDAEYGRDIRGRLFSEDLDQYLFADVRKVMTDGAGANPEALQDNWMRRSKLLGNYWQLVPAVIHNRDLWTAFLAHNHLPDNTLHEPAVREAEASLNTTLTRSNPSPEWEQQARSLQKAYAAERRRLARTLESDTSSTYHPRQSACPAPAQKTSGTSQPALGQVERSLEEFYPPEAVRQQLEGLVVLSVQVSATGCVTAAAVTGSSGCDELDAAALRWIETAHYLPAEQAGKPIDAKAHVAVDFKLND